MDFSTIYRCGHKHCNTQIIIHFSTIITMATTTINDYCSTQVQIIDGEGVFNVTGLDNFIKTSDMANTGLNYAVVGIIGPQSSGKSTLMNLLFHTRFKEMDVSKGRSQTTKGIWIDKCTGIKTCTIALDIEGTDGRERGEDDTAFEKQSALFALAVSDIVLINLWCHDVGREQAASKPLLRTVFQAMLPLLTSPRKITLIFMLRDKTPKTPLESLESILREDIQKIWNEIPKPKAHIHTPLGNFFNVEVKALSNYETQEEEFKKEVSELRKRFYHSTAPGGLAGDRCDVVPASGFSISAQKIWKSIQENKDLNLPAHKVMVATMRCEAIAKEKLDHLRSNKGWLKLMEAAQSGLAQGFGKKLNSIIGTYRSQYDEETEFYDEAVRNAKWKQLESDALNEAYLSYTTMIGHLRSKALADFKTKLEKSLNNGEGFTSSVRMCTQSIMLEFEKGSADTAPGQTNWNVSKVQDELRSDIDSHAELLGKFFCSDNDSHAELLKRKPPLKVFCSDNDSHAELLERKPRLKKAEKSAKTLKLVKEVAIATAVGAAVGVAGMSGMAAVIALTGGAAAVGTGAVAVSVVALAAPVLSVMYSVYEITNKYKNRAKPVKGRA